MGSQRVLLQVWLLLLQGTTAAAPRPALPLLC